MDDCFVWLQFTESNNQNKTKKRQLRPTRQTKKTRTDRSHQLQPFLTRQTAGSGWLRHHSLPQTAEGGERLHGSLRIWSIWIPAPALPRALNALHSLPWGWPQPTRRSVTGGQHRDMMGTAPASQLNALMAQRGGATSHSHFPGAPDNFHCTVNSNLS